MSQSQLSCYTRRENRRFVLALEGALDIVTAPQASEALLEFLGEHGPYVIVDASRLNFIDSKGVGTLLSASKAARDAGGTLFLREPALPVQKILEMCQLTNLFPSPPEPAEPPTVEVSPSPPRPSGTTGSPRPARRIA